MSSSIATEAFQESATSNAYGSDQIQVIINEICSILLVFSLVNNVVCLLYVFLSMPFGTIDEYITVMTAHK